MSTNNSTGSPEQLQREVDEQRSSIDQIVEALEKKMSPGQWIDQTIAYARENGGELAGNLGQNIKQNPLPAVLLSVSIAWLMLGQRSTADRSSASTVGNGVDSLKDKLQAGASNLKDKASQLGDLNLRQQGQRLQSGMTDLMHQQPLALAGVAIALGAAIGQNLPPGERQWARQLPASPARGAAL
ncbi:nutrient deprivation-induced protein [Pseudomonas sp. StFLB209]|uniref:DUF3618 domain-containing protein n=1 Tax=Pseudomonas sp. StFLB209 TaxID=1028989 RepID=UPI0004F7594C|nr:DUF3618 domain-containing protein [Pseudomonas sp. StFLB209]BAP44274.1 nutrient deprivation-induced protein [Pseudomonas sp. StFLB209]